MGCFIDLTGKKFGKLLVIKRVENDKYSNLNWECLCDCGNRKIIRGAHLRDGLTKSCGCYNYEQSTAFGKKWGGNNKTHGMKRTRLYYLWSNMKARCYNPKADSFKYYGGKGIKVCEEWKKNFVEFYKWSIENGYRDDLTIDRINNNKNYSPDNCKWATMKEQQNNRGNNHTLFFNGESHTLAEWADILGIKYSYLHDRLRRGWNMDKIISD